MMRRNGSGPIVPSPIHWWRSRWEPGAPRGPVVDVVAGMRHDPRDPERPRSVELARERPDALRPQRLVRRRQVDQIAVVRDNGTDPAPSERRAKGRDLGVPDHRLAP